MKTKRLICGAAILIALTTSFIAILVTSASEVTEPDEPIWLRNIHKVLPDWDPAKDEPIPDWAKPKWAVSPHGRPTEVSLHGPYADNVEWLNASDVFTPKWDCNGAVYIDDYNHVFYTLENITECPDKDIVDFILANKDKVGLAIFEDGIPEDDVPGRANGGG